MPVSLRTVFAILLALAALTPPVLYGVHVGSPAAAIELARGAQVVLRWTGIVAGAGLLVGVLVYPPFLPWLRLSVSRMRLRMGTDSAPMVEALARLRNLDSLPDHLLVGRAMRERGQPARAVGHLARAIELEPDNLPSRYQLGLALAELGAVPRAIEEFAFVVTRDEKHAFGGALLQLGALLVRVGDDRRAVDLLERHEALFGVNPRLLFELARAHRGLGERAAAADALRRAAQPPVKGAATTPEDALYRARAKAALLFGGRR